MKFLNWVFADIDDIADPSQNEAALVPDEDINPANGLPMIGAIDIEGNLYGTDGSGQFADESFDSGTDCDAFEDWSSSCDW